MDEEVLSLGDSKTYEILTEIQPDRMLDFQFKVPLLDLSIAFVNSLLTMKSKGTVLGVKNKASETYRGDSYVVSGVLEPLDQTPLTLLWDWTKRDFLLPFELPESLGVNTQTHIWAGQTTGLFTNPPVREDGFLLRAAKTEILTQHRFQLEGLILKHYEILYSEGIVVVDYEERKNFNKSLALLLLKIFSHNFRVS